MRYYGNRDHDFSPESIKEAKMSFEKMFEEIPVIIKNSHLVNSMLCELDDTISENQMFDHLDLGTRYGYVVFRVATLREKIQNLFFFRVGKSQGICVWLKNLERICNLREDTRNVKINGYSNLQKTHLCCT